MLARMTRRISLAVTLLTLALPAAAKAAPDLTVRSVADPVPTGRSGDYGFRLKATVVNAGSADSGRSRLRFALSEDRRLGPGDTRVPLVRVDALDPGERDTVTEHWQIPRGVEAGVYHVLACVGDDCKVAAETVAVTERGGETPARAGAPMPGATAPSAAPRMEFKPDEGWGTISAPLDCPASLHGQGDGRCVWVTTQPFTGLSSSGDPRVRDDFWTCPPGYGFPFEVALGFDPLWRDLGTKADTVVETVAAKRWTAYRSVGGREYYPSYGGSTARGENGYVSVQFRAHALTSRWTYQVEYLCSNKRASSMLP
jgi:hypothetical protein